MTPWSRDQPLKLNVSKFDVCQVTSTIESDLEELPDLNPDQHPWASIHFPYQSSSSINPSYGSCMLLRSLGATLLRKGTPLAVRQRELSSWGHSSSLPWMRGSDPYKKITSLLEATIAWRQDARLAGRWTQQLGPLEVNVSLNPSHPLCQGRCGLRYNSPLLDV